MWAGMAAEFLSRTRYFSFEEKNFPPDSEIEEEDGVGNGKRWEVLVVIGYGGMQEAFKMRKVSSCMIKTGGGRR